MGGYLIANKGYIIYIHGKDKEKFQPLKDYKVVCFNGKAKLIQVHKGRFINHTQDFYDSSWNR